ncbi:MAG: amidohydrolase family protein [Phycisphaerales bacterium]|jgi:cytosine/adenosine deaminase-related metal-dependent hydrolase|nr:amidohydrolase family protein [Phycisphaerales bacterium]
MTATCGEPVHKRRLIRAGGLLDAAGTEVAPGVVLVESDRVAAAGTPESIGSVPDAEIVDRTGELLVPGLVNAHCHLDLSGPGPWPPAGGDYRGWVGRVRSLRAEASEAQVRRAVRRGIALSLAGGTSCIGDIAGEPPAASIEELRRSPLQGTAFVECFGIGSGQPSSIERMLGQLSGCPADEAGVRVGVSPHAPYSCGPDVFAAAASTGRQLSTHLAETKGEADLLLLGSGPLREMLEKDIGVWNEGVRIPWGTETGMPRAASPVARVVAAMSGTGALCAHMNYLGHDDVDCCVAAGIRLVYCPRASASFGHAPPAVDPHPWLALREAGLTVCLGTDSLLCLDTPERISVLDDMRLLYRRDGVDPMILLEMATIAGADALEIPRAAVSLGPSVAGLVAVRSSATTPVGMLANALAHDGPPSWAVQPTSL